MLLELFMICSCIDSYQKNKRLNELEMKEKERDWARKHGIDPDASDYRWSEVRK